jgi:hypothetical protein
VVAVAARTTHKVIGIGSATVTVKAGGSQSVTVALNGTGRKLLSRFHQLHALVLVVQGKTNVGSHKVTFVAPKPKHKG